jgi:hypothetical protein
VRLPHAWSPIYKHVRDVHHPLVFVDLHVISFVGCSDRETNQANAALQVDLYVA